MSSPLSPGLVSIVVYFRKENTANPHGWRCFFIALFQYCKGLANGGLLFFVFVLLLLLDHLAK